MVVAEVDLLLQHDAVHAGLEEREDEARLALELAEAVEDLGRGLAGHGVEDRGELFEGGKILVWKGNPDRYIVCTSRVGGDRRKNMKGKEGERVAYLLHVLGQSLVLLQHLLLERRELGW